MALALAGVAVVTIAQFRIALGRFDDVDRRDEEVLADLHHALWMEGLESRP